MRLMLAVLIFAAPLPCVAATVVTFPEGYQAISENPDDSSLNNAGGLLTEGIQCECGCNSVALDNIQITSGTDLEVNSNSLGKDIPQTPKRYLFTWPRYTRGGIISLRGYDFPGVAPDYVLRAPPLIDVPTVPEPSSIALLTTALMALAQKRREARHD